MHELRAIYILWLRQTKRYLRSRSRVIGSLAQPVLFLVAFGFGFGPVFEQAGLGNYIQFLAPGIIAMSILFISIFAGIEIIWDRQFGFLKETLVAPVSRLSIMIGRTLGGATVAIFQGTIVLLISMLLGFKIVSWASLLLAFLIMILISVLFTAFGTAIASRLQDMQGFQLIMNFIIMPLFYLSGAAFPIESLPTVLLRVARANPLSYGVDALRHVLIGTSHFGFLLDLSVLTLLTLFFVILGSYLFSKIEI